MVKKQMWSGYWSPHECTHDSYKFHGRHVSLLKIRCILLRTIETESVCSSHIKGTTPSNILQKVVIITHGFKCLKGKNNRMRCHPGLTEVLVSMTFFVEYDSVVPVDTIQFKGIYWFQKTSEFTYQICHYQIEINVAEHNQVNNL